MSGAEVSDAEKQSLFDGDPSIEEFPSLGIKSIFFLGDLSVSLRPFYSRCCSVAVPMNEHFIEM